jgi:hypothetical protein
LLSVAGFPVGVFDPAPPPSLCRYAIARKAIDWCMAISGRPSNVRVHANATFIAGDAPQILPAEPGEQSVRDFRLYFGSWGFNSGVVYAYR